MYPELKENRPHGTDNYPYTQYHMHNIFHAFQIPVHWHDELEVIYTKKGPLNLLIDGKEYTAEDGSVYLVAPGQLHLMGSDRIAANQKNGYQNQLGTRILLLKLVLLMAEQDLFYPSHTKSTSSLQKELLSYIQQNYCFRISLHDLAGHFHMSEKYISRYFREHFQLTLSQYITYLRLSHAKHLLETTSLSITETALQSGFPNVSYFIRTFKNTFHVPPLQYRNSIR